MKKQRISGRGHGKWQTPQSLANYRRKRNAARKARKRKDPQ